MIMLHENSCLPIFDYNFVTLIAVVMQGRLNDFVCPYESGPYLARNLFTRLMCLQSLFQHIS